MVKARRLRFAIDNGGTFTDMVVLDEETGEFWLEKAPTTPSNTLIGLLDVIEKAKLDLAHVSRFFVHGSTTAVNALLQRKGVKTAYITTKGFRDVPEIMRYNRPEIYNPKYHKPAQIVPRELRFEVTERVNARGEVLVDLDLEEVRQLARAIRKKEVASVAVCLLHSYINPAHERAVKAILAEECPGLEVTISNDVVREHREFERSMTTILNAYLAPVVEVWIDKLEGTLRERGFAGEVVLTRSDGGGMTCEMVKKAPINTLLSGPAGGVIGGMFIANNFNHPNLITMDVGGTSYDVCLIKSGQVRTEQVTNIGGYACQIPNIDIRSIGAGGGSIAWIDDAGALRVGPQSAGASPGPMCYGKGGAEPTVTDALVCNGYMDPNNFLGGRMQANANLAVEGIKSRVCKPLNMDLHAGSSGILRIALSHMAEATKEIAAEHGDDPREFGLLCFGGGGPLFGSFLLDELEMAAAIIPVAPSTFSAWGMLMVDVRHDYTASVMKKLDAISMDALGARFDALVTEGMDIMAREGIPPQARRILKSLDIRYAGQEHTVSVPFDVATDGDSKAKLYDEFTRVYTEVYGYHLTPAPAEVVNARIAAVGEIPKARLKEIGQGTQQAQHALKGSRDVFDYVKGDWLRHDLYDRTKLLANNLVVGPALIEEPTTVTVVREGHRCEVDRLGNLVITRAARTSVPA